MANWQALSDRVFHVPGALAPTQCEALIALANAHGFDAAQVRATSGTRAMPQVRNNQRAQFAAPDWVATLWQLLQSWPLPLVNGQRAVGLPRDLLSLASADSLRTIVRVRVVMATTLP